MLVKPFAVGLLVHLAVDVDASDAAACAAGSAFGTVFAEQQPRLPVGSAGVAEVPVAQGLAAILVSTDVPHERLAGVVAPLVFEAPVDRTVPCGLCRVAVLAALVLLEVRIAKYVRCRDAHVRPHTCGGVLRGVVDLLPPWHRYLWVYEGKPQLVEVAIRRPCSSC